MPRHLPAWPHGYPSPVRRLLLIAAALVAFAMVPAQAGAVSGSTTRFIATFEGFVPCPYADPAGHATIGYGHLLHYGPPTRADWRKWGCLTKAEGLALLRKDLRYYESEVLRRLRGATVTPAMITALTSFAFNLGPGALDFMKGRPGRSQNTNISAHVRKGNYYKAGKQLLLFDGIIVGGKRIELEGLQIRRRKEYRLLVRDVDAIRACNGNLRCVQKLGSGGLEPRKSGGISLRPR
jgi:GH24 family phage-related lysozyme (muramidase)